VADVRGRLDTLTYVTGDEGNREELVPVAGAQVWTATSGSGPGLVLTHGGPGMSDDLGALARMVEDLAAVHRYDQRACGRSTGQGAGQTVASALADLDALREHTLGLRPLGGRWAFVGRGGVPR
jgi:pimeloyl-ACP methyl ester carboxylesterase